MVHDDSALVVNGISEIEEVEISFYLAFGVDVFSSLDPFSSASSGQSIGPFTLSY